MTVVPATFDVRLKPHRYDEIPSREGPYHCVKGPALRAECLHWMNGRWQEEDGLPCAAPAIWFSMTVDGKDYLP